MVVVGNGSYHHITAHCRTGFVSAPQSVALNRLPFPICSSASCAWSCRPRFLVRSLHHLSTFANSSHSPATDRTRGALSFDQRECGGHDCQSEEHTSELQSPYDLVC